MVFKNCNFIAYVLLKYKPILKNWIVSFNCVHLVKAAELLTVAFYNFEFWVWDDFYVQGVIKPTKLEYSKNESLLL